MSEQLSRLLSHASGAIAGAPSESAISSLATVAGAVRLAGELSALLADNNGFYAFESALLVRPLDNERSPLGVLQWNHPRLWRGEYKIDLGRSVYFSEDIFGIQFCLKDDSIHSFDPETGKFTRVANTLEEWAHLILENHRLRTGWPLAHQWQVQHGPLPLGVRLLPKVPFVCNGAFAIENLYILNDAEGMRFRASLANQLVGVPDGTAVVFKINRSK